MKNNIKGIRVFNTKAYGLIELQRKIPKEKVWVVRSLKENNIFPLPSNQLL